jgi:parvulin-like peptidyl-prolyl isomerase
MCRRCATSCGLGLLLTVVSGFWLPVLSQSFQSPREGPANEIPLQGIVVRTAEEAQSILDRLKTGEGFAQLAREKSIDPTAEQGGYMGEFNPAELRAELRDALRGVDAGQVSPITHIPSGYAILKVMEKTGSPRAKAR